MYTYIYTYKYIYIHIVSNTSSKMDTTEQNVVREKQKLPCEALRCPDTALKQKLLLPFVYRPHEAKWCPDTKLFHPKGSWLVES